MRKKLLILTLALSWLIGSTNAKQTTNTNETKHELNGKATYYGSQYTSTRRTANGEVFDKDAYTAAHKTLPFGTIVKVTNLNNKKAVTVRITDRGPFIEGRVIDLTPVAARDIDMLNAGVVPVTVEIVSLPVNKKTKKKV
jgi:rare lipoprotein A